MKKKLKKHITFCFHGEKCWEKKVIYIYIYIINKNSQQFHYIFKLIYNFTHGPIIICTHYNL